MNLFDIIKYLKIALKRKYLIIISFLLVLLAGLTYGMITPKMYKGETLILMVTQKVPETYVKSIVNLSMEERLRTIRQQVTSRTNLERIIEEHKLFDNPTYGITFMQEKVKAFRKRIQINVAPGTSFRISFEDEDPNKAMDGTNKLASNFISENLRMREERAIGTSQFLADNLESVRKDLEEKEELIKQYRQMHMGAMPDNLNTNLNVLGRIQTQLEQLHNNLRAAQERKLIIQQQIANTEMMKRQMTDAELVTPSVETDLTTDGSYGASSQVTTLRDNLKLLESRYTDNHPDVKRLKELIAKIEAEEAKAYEPEDNALAEQPMPELSMTDLLRPQLDQVNIEITNLRAAIGKAESQVELYQERIEETPKREQELISLNRDYDNLRNLYNSLLQRKLESEIALDMEKKQKGEQFKVIDPAKFPEQPFRPDHRKILLITIIVALVLGGGLVFMVETLDTSYKTPEEVEEDLGVPVLMSMPIRYTQNELRKQKLRDFVMASSVAAAFVLAAVSIVLATKGVNETMNYVKTILDRI
jgi:polysaccharide chain length determinant protein (PEP-CTERM system associated)